MNQVRAFNLSVVPHADRRNGINVDGFSRSGAAALAIADAVAEAFLTCKACVRCEGDVALGIDVHHTVRGVDLLCAARR